MCLNKVYVRDRYRLSGTGNYFPCGRCKACRQASANRRARRIVNHHPNLSTCYFVTLGYRDGCAPYISLSELKQKLEDNIYNDVSSFPLNVYRDSILKRNGKVVPSERTRVRTVPVLNSFCFSDLCGLSGMRRFISKTEFEYDSDKISVAFTPDAQKFLKRLRTHLLRYYGYRIPIDYFCAPEYGPTTQRFHLHLLLWFPSYISEATVKYHICETWPFADRQRTSDYVEIARSPARYLASYVNSSNNVSEFLLQAFKLKATHSNHFGFNEDLFDFSQVFRAYKERRFTYDAVGIKSSGEVYSTPLLYPRYITNKYFPRFKGYNRTSCATIRNVLKNPRKYMSLTPVLTKVSRSGQEYYRSSIVDVYGQIILFTKSEANMYCRLIDDAYRLYYAPRGYSRDEFADIVIDYNNQYIQYLYKEAVSVPDPLDGAYSFYNLNLVRTNTLLHITNESIDKVISDLTIDQLDCNQFPNEILETVRLEKQYDDNIKQRKINQL